MKTKICTKCGIEKELTEYYKAKDGKYGYAAICKICLIEYHKQRYQKNKTKCNELSKTYYQKNKEKICERGKKYRQDNKEKLRQYYQENKEKNIIRAKHYNENNKDILAERRKKYEKENKEKIREWNKQYYQENKEKRKEYYNTRYRNNPYYRFVRLQRDRRRLVFKKYQWTKESQFNILFSCDKKTFLLYFNNLFIDGMTWENHGKHGWHADHIIAIVNFDLRDSKQEKICFHYTNYQPLWADVNQSKHAKLIPNWKEKVKSIAIAAGVNPDSTIKHIESKYEEAT